MPADPKDVDKHTRRHGMNTLRSGIPIRSGRDYKIVLKTSPFAKAYWSPTECLVGEQVSLVVELKKELAGPVALTVYRQIEGGEPLKVSALEANIDKKKATAPFTAMPEEEELVGGTHETKAEEEAIDEDEPLDTQKMPRFFFEASSKSCKKKSGTSEAELLKVVHALAVRLLDADWKPLSEIDVKIAPRGGGTKTQKTDAEGKLFLKPVPPGVCELTVKGHPEISVPTTDLAGFVIDVRVPEMPVAEGDPPEKDDLFDPEKADNEPGEKMEDPEPEEDEEDTDNEDPVEKDEEEEAEAEKQAQENGY